MTRARNGAAPVAPTRAKRQSGPSGAHKAPRLVVQLPVTSQVAELWWAAAEADGLTLSAWLVEAAKARVRALVAAGLMPRDD